MLAMLAAFVMAGDGELGWMAGAWHGDVWGGHMEEHWTAASGGTLLGLNRVVKDGTTAHREFLSIESREGKTVMTVFLARQTTEPLAPVSFNLVELKDRRAVFTNPEHERLSRIVYRRDGNMLHILLEGRRQEKPFSDEIVLKRS